MPSTVCTDVGGLTRPQNPLNTPAVEETNLQNLSCAEHVPRNETQFIVQNRFADPEPVPVVPQIINSTNFDAKVGPLGGSCFKLMSQ